jgi:GDP-4-dehydro-6-deoxy-D-mannose reductase
MRVLVTGATGFAGRHLVRLCKERGADVAGIGRRPEAEARPPGELDRYLQADLGDRDQIVSVLESERPDLVFHLAAEASVAQSWDQPERTIDANVSGALNLLETIRKVAPEIRVLIACSGEEYGPVPASRLPIAEKEPLRPKSPYGVSKAAVDLLGGFYADAHGMRVVRTRAFNHTGPGQSDRYVVASFARQIAEARARGEERVELVTGNLDVRRDFTDVRDVVLAYWLALEGAEPGIFNVCSGNSVALSELPARLGRHADIEVSTRMDPERLRQVDVPDSYGSRARLTEATGWEPELSLDTTLRDTLDWWDQQLRREADA